jgi:hypothetical protein
MTEDSGAFKTIPQRPPSFRQNVTFFQRRCREAAGREKCFSQAFIAFEFSSSLRDALRYSWNEPDSLSRPAAGPPKRMADPVVTAFPDGSRALAELLQRRNLFPMLPGFRFLFAAIVLSMSVLVFGLGAAAVLRAAHEQFSESGSWRPAPDTAVAERSETSSPVLAMLRVDPQTTAPKAADAVPVPPSAQPAALASQLGPEKVAAPDPQTPAVLGTSQAEADTDGKAEVDKADGAKPEADKPEVANAEVGRADIAPEKPNADDKDAHAAEAPSPAPPAQLAREEAPAAAQPAAAGGTPAATDSKVAAADSAPPAAPAPAATLAVSPPPASNEDRPPTGSASDAAASAAPEAPPAAPGQPSAPAAADPSTASIATLGGPPAAIAEPAPEKAGRAAPDPIEARKKEREKERAEEQARRRRLAARRARLAQQAAQAQQAANPFGQTNQMQFVQPGLANASARSR